MLQLSIYLFLVYYLFKDSMCHVALTVHQSNAKRQRLLLILSLIPDQLDLQVQRRFSCSELKGTRSSGYFIKRSSIS